MQTSQTVINARRVVQPRGESAGPRGLASQRDAVPPTKSTQSGHPSHPQLTPALAKGKKGRWSRAKDVLAMAFGRDDDSEDYECAHG